MVITMALGGARKAFFLTLVILTYISLKLISNPLNSSCDKKKIVLNPPIPHTYLTKLTQLNLTCRELGTAQHQLVPFSVIYNEKILIIAYVKGCCQKHPGTGFNHPPTPRGKTTVYSLLLGYVLARCVPPPPQIVHPYSLDVVHSFPKYFF